MSFNTTTYDSTNVAYNIESPIYIDGTTPTIPIKGFTYYPGIIGNVMCAFAVDGGDSLLGGNTVVSGVLSVGGDLRVGGNTICSGNVLYNSSTNILFPTTSAVITRLYYNQMNETVQLIDANSNVVSVANALPNVSYRIISLKNVVNSNFYQVINNTPGSVGIYLNAYDASTNATNYGFTDLTINSVGYVIWNCPITLSNNTVSVYMYGLTNIGAPNSPNSRYVRVAITNTTSPVSAASLSYLSGATSNLQTQISTISLTPGATGATGATGAAGATGDWRDRGNRIDGRYRRDRGRRLL